MTYSAGKHWPTLGVPVAEPYQPPTDRRPGGWPKTGTAGAKASLGDDEHPAAVPARPYRVTLSPMIADPPRTAAQAAAFRAVNDAIRANIAAYAQAVHDTLAVSTRRPDPATVSPALRHRLIARAIGWFRR